MAQKYKKEIQNSARALFPHVMEISKCMNLLTRAANQQGLMVDWNTGKVFEAPKGTPKAVNPVEVSMSTVREAIKDFNINKQKQKR